MKINLNTLRERYFKKSSNVIEQSVSVSIETMRMDVFIRMIVSGNHSPLSEQNWNDIMTDYLTQSGSQSAIRAVAHEREVYFLTNQIYLTNRVVAMVANTGHPLLLELLRNMGYRHIYAPDTLESDLQSILNTLKQKEVRIAQIKHELAAMQATTGTPVTAKDFYRQLDALAEYRKIPTINPADITVADYCAKLVRFTEYIQSQKQNGSR